MKETKTFNYPQTRKYKLAPGEEGFRLLVRIYKSNAKKKNREFVLTAEEFKNLTKGNCHYCGVIPGGEISNHNIKNSSTRNHGVYVYNGIDRKDPSKGYILENCLSCCRQCNTAKMDMTYNEFTAYIERLSTFRRSC